ncbi:MAG: mechanosensitive ion channel protein MscS [Methanomicrobiales archaeon HGW-Methanomicrobiales-1]|jgi:small-conductance mechanosensitive channel|nr:MAG: mechanosensitive ion channel protein MscS [Methanomicrobiales archaeon HGW-Methanomicrobiales-1]
MKRQLLIFSAFLLLSVALGAAAHIINEPVVMDLFSTSLVLTITYLVFPVITGIFLVRKIADLKTRYTAKKAISIISVIFIIALCLRIWVTDTSALIVSYGIIGAALAFALQDVFKNFVGGLLVIITSMYRIGDRIAIDNQFGDVMDIGLMSTTLMEIRGWVSGDQPSGRLLILPNGLLITHALYNYTRDHSFVWDEISIPLTYDSDWKLAKELVLGIVTKETALTTKQADAEIERIGEKYYLPKKVVDPSAYITLTDNWITLDVRYVTDARSRRILRSKLSELILSAIEKEDRITISSTTVTVTTTGETLASRKDQKTGSAET